MLAPGVVWRNAVWILLSFVAVSAVGWATLASAAEGPAVTPLDGSTDAGDLAGHLATYLAGARLPLAEAV